MNPWLDPEFGRDENSSSSSFSLADVDDNDEKSDRALMVVPSTLTRVIVIESPRRGPARKGFGWYRCLKGDTQQAIEQLERITAERLSRAAVPSSTAHPPRPARIIEKAMAYYDSPAVRRAFLSARSTTPLWVTQQAGVAFMAKHEQGNGVGAIIAEKMRKGKTLMIASYVLTELQERVRRGERRFGAPTLFVVPSQAVKTVVGQIYEHFGAAATCPLNVVVISSKHPLGDQVDAFQDLFGACDVIVTTYDTLVASYRRDKKAAPAAPRASLLSIQYHRVVADEAHVFCNQTNQYFTVMMSLVARFRWYVTGTPIRNSVNDLVAPLIFLRLPGPVPRVYDPGFKAFLHAVMLRSRDAHPEEVDDQVVMLDFRSSSERRLYACIQHHTRDTLHQQPSTETQKLALILRLRQVCAEPHLLHGTTDLDLESRVHLYPMRRTAAAYLKDCFAAQDLAPGNLRYRLHDRRRSVMDKLDERGVERLHRRIIPFVCTKARYVLDYLDTHVTPAGEKLVVFSSWAGYLALLGRVLTRRSKLRGDATTPHIIVHGKVDGREELFTRFREDPTKSVLLLTFGTGGVSLDLTCANHVITPDLWFNPYTEDQAIARLKGVRQTRPIHIRRLVVRDTIDEKILLLSKTKRQYENWLLSDKPDAPAPDPDDMATVCTQNTASILVEWIMNNKAREEDAISKKRKRVEEAEGGRD